MFTVCFGIALGLVAHQQRARYAVVPLIGYLAAVGAHGIWNGATLTDLWLPLYFLLQVALFIGFITMVIFARRRETRMIRDHLTGYGMNGWFSPGDVAILTCPGSRRRARRWARQTLGPAGEVAMRAFQDESSELAIAGDHLERGDSVQWWGPKEQALLSTCAAHRSALDAMRG